MKKEDFNIIKEKTEAVKKAIMEVGEKAYKNIDPNASSENDVIETDFSSEK